MERSGTSKNGRRSACGISHRVGFADDCINRKKKLNLNAQRRRPHAKRVSSRTQSVFHRAGGFFRSGNGVDAGGDAYRSGHGVPFIAPGAVSVLRLSGRGRRFAPFCGLFLLAIYKHTVSFIAHTECVSSRTQNVFHHTVGFHRSVARRTREVTPAVLRPSSFCGFLRTWNVRLLRLGLYKYSEFTEKKKRSRLVLRKNRRAGRFCAFAAFGNGMGKECPAQAAA